MAEVGKESRSQKGSKIMDEIEMTEEQTALLKPYADRLQALQSEMAGMTSDQLRALIAASAAATKTNCWARIHDAARMVEGAAAVELSFRREPPTVKQGDSA